MTRTFPASRENLSGYKKKCINKYCVDKKQEKDLYMEEYETRNKINLLCYKTKGKFPTKNEMKKYGNCFDKLASKTNINKKISKTIKCIKKKCSKDKFISRTKTMNNKTINNKK